MFIFFIKVAGCGGITYEPQYSMWTLRTGTTPTASAIGEISYLKECLDAEVPAGVGRIFLRSLVKNCFSRNKQIFIINYS